MTAVAWHAALPKDFLENGYSETRGENVLREQMDVGPAKTRRRATVTPVTVTGTMHMTRKQFQIWERFYEQALLHGTVPFTMQSLDGTLREMFIVEPPNSTLVEPYVAVSMTLEYIP